MPVTALAAISRLLASSTSDSVGDPISALADPFVPLCCGWPDWPLGRAPFCGAAPGACPLGGVIMLVAIAMMALSNTMTRDWRCGNDSFCKAVS